MFADVLLYNYYTLHAVLVLPMFTVVSSVSDC